MTDTIVWRLSILYSLVMMVVHCLMLCVEEIHGRYLYLLTSEQVLLSNVFLYLPPPVIVNSDLSSLYKVSGQFVTNVKWFISWSALDSFSNLCLLYVRWCMNKEREMLTKSRFFETINFFIVSVIFSYNSIETFHLIIIVNPSKIITYLAHHIVLLKMFFSCVM